MKVRIVLLAMMACGVAWGDAQAQLALRKQTRQRTAGVCLTGCQEEGGVGGCPCGADQGLDACAEGELACGCGGLGHHGKGLCPCSCAQGSCQMLAYPRCFRFESPCARPGACDPCCGTIFSEMYCDVRDAFARLGCCGRPVLGRPLLGGPVLGGGLFGLARSEDCCDGSCGGGCCSEWSEPGCGYVEQDCGYAEPGCEFIGPECGVADVGCGIAEPSCAGLMEPCGGCAEPACGCHEPACGVAMTCEPACGAGVACEPACGVGVACEPACGVGVACEPACGVGGGCFQDLVGPSCGAGAARGCCGGCGLVRPGLFASIGNLLFGGCHSGCSGCAPYDGTYPDCGCAAPAETYYEEHGDEAQGQPAPAVPPTVPEPTAAPMTRKTVPATGTPRRQATARSEKARNPSATIYVGRRPATPVTTRPAAPSTSRQAPSGGEPRSVVAPTSHGAGERRRAAEAGAELELRPPMPPSTSQRQPGRTAVRRVNHDAPQGRATQSRGGQALAILFGGDAS